MLGDHTCDSLSVRGKGRAVEALERVGKGVEEYRWKRLGSDLCPVLKILQHILIQDIRSRWEGNLQEAHTHQDPDRPLTADRLSLSSS